LQSCEKHTNTPTLFQLYGRVRWIINLVSWYNYISYVSSLWNIHIK